jgi:branched-subunit amino acid transport protein AzlD
MYMAFALLTDWKDYQLVAKPEGYLRWTIIRLSTVTMWLFVAALLLRYRKHGVNWRSFSYAFITTCIIAIVISSSLVTKSANDAVIAGTIVFYALVSGFLCATVSKPTIAAVLGLLLFAAQFFVDAIAHIFSGVFRFH